MHPTGVGSPLVIGSFEVVLDDGSGKLFRPSNVEPLVQDPGPKNGLQLFGADRSSFEQLETGHRSELVFGNEHGLSNSD